MVGGWGHRRRGSQAPRCGGRGGQAPFKAPWDTTGGSSHHPPSHPFSQTCPLLFSLASPEPLSGPSSLVRLYPCASLAPRLVPIPILGSVSSPPPPIAPCWSDLGSQKDLFLRGVMDLSGRVPVSRGVPALRVCGHIHLIPLHLIPGRNCSHSSAIRSTYVLACSSASIPFRLHTGLG